MADTNETFATWSALRSRIDTFRRIPDLLTDHPVEANAVRQLLTTVEGADATAQQECGMLWKAGRDDLATAVFLGGRWAVTALHCVVDGAGADYHVTLPAQVPTDLHPKNSFHVMETFPAPGGVDLALLHLATGLAPAVDPPVIATATEVAQANAVLVCGFGSDDCGNPAGAGRKRISVPFALAASTDDPTNLFLADNGAETPRVCPSDSGGAVYLAAGGKLAGLVSATVLTPGQHAVTRCVRLTPLLPWIHSKAGLNF